MRQPITFLLLLSVIMSVVSSSANAETSIDDSRRTAIVRAIEKAAPAVVSINVVQIQRERVIDPLFNDFWGFFDLPPSRIREREIQSIGSGFIFDDEGHIVTNYHVLAGADSIASVSLPDGRNLDVEYVGSDEHTDLAILKAKGANLPFIAFGDSDNLLIGEWSIAIGNPFGFLMSDKQPSVSVGVISANHRRVAPSVGEGKRLYQNMIQTDAAINPGNSGGPLVNAMGQAIGVNTMIFSQSGGSVGLGFALPINRVQRVAKEIIQYGHRREPWAGFNVKDIGDLPAGLLNQLGVADTKGCLVTDIRKDCPAYKAGLDLADIVVSINGLAISSAADVEFAFWDLFVGDKASITVKRQDKEKKLSFDIVEKPER